MGVETLIGAGASLLGAGMQSDAAGDAADTQSKAAREATALQKAMYDQTVQRNQPFVQGGTQAFNALMGRLGLNGQAGDLGRMPTAADVMNEPGYQFGLDQGLQAQRNALNARGMSYSGAALKAATRYGNDYASGQYGNAFNRNLQGQQQTYNQLAGLAGMGQASANNTASAGQQFGAQAGNNMMGAANAQAAGGLGQANAWTNALNQTASMYKNMPQQPGQPGVNPGATWGTDPMSDPWWQG